MATAGFDRAAAHIEQAASRMDSAAQALLRLGSLGSDRPPAGGGGGGAPGGGHDWFWPMMMMRTQNQYANRSANQPTSQHPPPPVSPDPRQQQRMERTEGDLRPAPGIPSGRWDGGTSPARGSEFRQGRADAGTHDLMGERGRLAALTAFTESLGRAKEAASAHATVISRLNRDYVGLASPNVAATLTGSADMMKARVGAILVPAMEMYSRTMQRGAAAIDALPESAQSWGGWFAKIGAASAGGATTLGAMGMPFGLGVPLGFVGGLGGGLYGAFEGGDTKRSMAGLPGPTMTSSEQFWESTAMKSLQMGSNTVEQDIYRKQLEQLEKIAGALLDMKDRRQDSFPAYR